jgi:L-alanine-DL-glutamate epimerase-like enolase superfamily enzyme
VREVHTHLAQLRLPRPLQIGDSIVDQREYAAVRVHTHDGLVGNAYCLSRNAPIAEIIDRLIAPHVLGLDTDDVPAIWDHVMRATAIVGRVGLVRRALGLVDIALWDIAAQRQNVPLWELVGRTGEARRAMLVASYPTSDRNSRDVADEVLRHAADGWALLKVARTPDNALMRDVVDTLSRELPPAASLVVDASFGWRSADHALSEIRTWTSPRLAWLEDPLLPEDPDGYGRLRRESGLPIGAGDEVTDPGVLDRLAASDGLDVARVDVVALGGITPTIGVIDKFEQLGLPISAHVYPEVTVHLGVDIETFSRESAGNPYDPAPTLVRGGPHIERGVAIPPTAPGLGFTLDESLFRRA